MPSFCVVVEACLTVNRAEMPDVRDLVHSYIRVQARRRFEDGHVPPFLPGSSVPLHDAPLILTDYVRSLRVCDVSYPLTCTWTSLDDVEFRTRFYHLHDDAVEWQSSGAVPAAAAAVATTAGPSPSPWCAPGAMLPTSVDDGDDSIQAFTLTQLPHVSLEGQWESLYYGECEEASLLFKRDIVSYVDTAMRFSRAAVNHNLISWNRLVLFHGPPGTGKTSLCRALAHKLAIRLSAAGFPRACLLDINAHSLFSRWFSESGKQVLQLFERVHRIAADRDCLVCVVMDEVESLAAARASAMKGNEPSDSIRVVNALLTQMDRLQRRENILVLATSNLTGAIDEALLDRADKRVFVGPPGAQARQSILLAGVRELLEKGLVAMPLDGGHGAAAVSVDAELSQQSAASQHDTEEHSDMRAAQTSEDTDTHDMQGAVLRDEEDVSGTQREDDVKQRHRETGARHSSSPLEKGDGDAASQPYRQHRQQRFPLTRLIRHIAEVSAGLNGRTLKKLPFLACSRCMTLGGNAPHIVGAGEPDAGEEKDQLAVPLVAFLEALFDVARKAATEAAEQRAGVSLI